MAMRYLRPVSNHLGRRTCACSAAVPSVRSRNDSAFQRREQLTTSAPAAVDPIALRRALKVSDEVSEAVRSNKPVVALESTIYTHGALGNDLASEHEELVRHHGGIPAIIGILDGVPKVGVTPKEIIRMIEEEGTVKASRRDIAYLVGMGLAGRKIHGGTTISGTMLLARLAGIRVFGTGGLGGVHRGGENSMDVSADLTELGRTRVAVISSGCKGFLDIPRTLEFLETQGCLVSTFADGRTGNIDFPAFWARDSGTRSPSVVYTEKEAAAMILSQERLGIESGMLFANPIPERHAIPSDDMRATIEQAVREADEKGFTGNANTPYVLKRLKELTGEGAVASNKALVVANIERATKVAVELSSMLSAETAGGETPIKPITSTPSPQSETPAVPPQDADILVAGAIALDLSCDYSALSGAERSPQLHTSNPAHITQSVGGVGHNVALAAHRVSKKAHVKLCSVIGDDVAGSSVLSSAKASGLDTTYIRRLSGGDGTEGRTAQYVAVNDSEKNLVLAMADMGILSQHPFSPYWKDVLAKTRPKWLVVDGNWAAKDVRSWVKAGRSQGCRVAFEPVSAEKSRHLFCPPRNQPVLGCFPEGSVDLASPNTYELSAMYSAAKENGYLDRPEWFAVIDAFGMRGARDRFVQLTSAELTDAGVPVQSVQLLPYIPTIVTKLGAKGVLLTELLGPGDPRLRDRDSAEYILARAGDHPTIGGIYMRMFPPAETVKDVVSVNGVGDTFLGVLISGLAQGGSVEGLVGVAQRGAVCTLKSPESVNPELCRLESELTQAVRLLL